jgi:hypothetical protein
MKKKTPDKTRRRAFLQRLKEKIFTKKKNSFTKKDFSLREDSSQIP